MQKPTLFFKKQARQKLAYMCEKADTEVGLMGISSKQNPLYITDVRLVEQEAGWASVEFTDDGLFEYDKQCREEGLAPEEYFRIWIHTHPGNSPTPSGVDEDTFSTILGQCDWAVMYIMAKDGAEYARLRTTFPVPFEQLLDIEVYDPVNHQETKEWDKALQELVTKKVYTSKSKTTWSSRGGTSYKSSKGWYERTQPELKVSEAGVYYIDDDEDFFDFDTASDEEVLKHLSMWDEEPAK